MIEKINKSVTVVVVKVCFFLIIQINPFILYSQFTDRVWCFGDSAGIDFSNVNNPVSFHSNIKAKGSCVSICDNNSKLLFYAYTRAGLIGETTYVMDSTHSLMLNGDNVAGCCWYNELLIIPKPADTASFFLISNATVTAGGLTGLFYSEINKTQNNGLGAVVQKNVLISNNNRVDAMIGIRHGNGRDWWVILHAWNGTNTFYKYYVSPTGISLYGTQNIGQLFNLDECRFAFSYITSKFLSVTINGQIQLLEFDRCSGQFSNQIVIENPSVYSKIYVACSISPNGNVAYVSNTNNISNDSLTLYQFDLTASNIFQSRQAIFKQPVPASGGLHAMGPDGKIYISCLDISGYPYADTIHNVYTDNISVINYPDSLGIACDFQPFSFNLGGNRAYWGMPNNPNYEAGAWVGSLCDTLVGNAEITIPINQTGNLEVYYASGWQTAFINAHNLSGNNYSLRIYDILGNTVFIENGNLTSSFFTKDLDCSGFKTGSYMVVLNTVSRQLSKSLLIIN